MEERLEKPPYLTLREAQNLGICLRAEGKKIVVVQGVYDLLHIGHVKYLEKAKACGDILIVGVDSDEFTKQRKGPHRPIVPENERIAMLLALRSVDYVIIREANEDKDDLVRLIRPDVLVISETTKDFANFEQVLREKLKDYCGEIVCFEPQAVTSTTNRIREIAQTGSIDKLTQFYNDINKLFKRHGLNGNHQKKVIHSKNKKKNQN